MMEEVVEVKELWTREDMRGGVHGHLCGGGEAVSSFINTRYYKLWIPFIITNV